MKVFSSPAELAGHTGKPLGSSAFRCVDQDLIDSFAEVTGDRQWIHVDVARARAGPYGSPIAHGMLTLSMAVAMLGEIFVVDGVDLVVNKGFDRVRFGGPVPSGARVRLSAELLEARPRPREFTEAVVRLTMETDGGDRPAYTADLRLLYHRAPPDDSSALPEEGEPGNDAGARGPA